MRRLGRRALAGVVAGLLAAGAVTDGPRPAVAEEDGAAPAHVHSTPDDYDTLRLLLGLPTAKPPAPAEPAAAPAPATQPPPTPVPAVAEPEPETAVPVPASVAPPKARPVAPAPRPAPARPKKIPTAPPPSAVEAVQEESPEPARPAVAVPEPGSVVDATNAEQWRHLLGPSIQWAVSRGATLDVIAATPAPIERVRLEATERYSPQVRLGADKRSMENYVAGIPFPNVQDDDPDLAIKTVFNFESRIIHDDLDLRGSSCETCAITDEGIRIEKYYLSAHLRRLFYVSRLHNEPKPTWPTIDGLRYRELVEGLLEPFDLKGAGYTYARYLSPLRQDDSWVYYPSSRRVRRLSTAQRSEGVFGTDIDLDSFAGYSGNPAWADWEYLGSKTILASLHARNVPVRYEAAPADFFPDDVWEPRDVHIVVGTPRFTGGVFSRRVLYIDKESLLIPYAEIYDMKGGLWKGLVFTWRNDFQPMPTAKRAIYDEKMAFHMNFSIFDMQLDHATRCASPSRELPEEEGWYYNFGEREGTVEEAFSVAGVISAAR